MPQRPCGAPEGRVALYECVAIQTLVPRWVRCFEDSFQDDAFGGHDGSHGHPYSGGHASLHRWTRRDHSVGIGTADPRTHPLVRHQTPSRPVPATGARQTGDGTVWRSGAPNGSRDCTRALSVAIPVFAYICRYSFEIKTNASRARRVGVQRDRAQIRSQAVELDPTRPESSSGFHPAVMTGCGVYTFGRWACGISQWRVIGNRRRCCAASRPRLFSQAAKSTVPDRESA